MRECGYEKKIITNLKIEYWAQPEGVDIKVKNIRILEIESGTQPAKDKMTDMCKQ